MICNIQIPNMGKKPDINREILTHIASFPCSIRKELRLLAKQYEIFRVHRDPPLMHEPHQLDVPPVLIEYGHFGFSEDEFTWEIDYSKIHNHD